jgi:hypothetical protein
MLLARLRHPDPLHHSRGPLRLEALLLFVDGGEALIPNATSHDERSGTYDALMAASVVVKT